MDYKVAKKLKDAGFESKDSALTGRSKPDKDGYVTPHLSELIEACDYKIALTVEKERSTAVAFNKADGVMEIEASKTPEEAVAKLWLKLNIKS